MTFFDKLIPVLVFLFIGFILVRSLMGSKGSPAREMWSGLKDRISGGRERLREKVAQGGDMNLAYE